MQLGWLLGSLGRDPETLGRLRQAIELAEALVADDPGATAATCWPSASPSAATPAERGPDRRGPAEIAAGAGDPRTRWSGPGPRSSTGALATGLRGVGRAEAAAGRPAEARAAFERASSRPPPGREVPGPRYNLACNLALMIPVAEPARREALARQTVETLRRALATGYANVGSLRADPDLDALRQRPDFRALLAGMRDPADAGDDALPAGSR